METLKNIFTEIDPTTGENSFEVEHSLVVDMEKRIQSEYDDIFTGNINEFTSFPDMFQYKKDMSISIQGLEDLIKIEKSKRKHKYNQAYGLIGSERRKMENDLKV